MFVGTYDGPFASVLYTPKHRSLDHMGNDIQTFETLSVSNSNQCDYFNSHIKHASR